MAGYPSESDFGTFLEREGIVVVAPDDGALADYLTEAIEIWERETGWMPFYLDTSKADTDETFRWFSGPEAIITPPKGILSLTTLVVDSVTMVIDDDYRLSNKRIYGPYQSIELINWSNRCADPLVTLTGKFGYTNDLPVGAKLGIFSIALAQGGIMDQLQGNLGAGAVTREKQGPVDIAWSVSSMDNPVGLRAVHSARSTKAVARYKRRTA